MATAKTPVTMLSGFLGSGKTTLLRFLLENSKEKIACIVNDVASINIDAKLVRNDRNRAQIKGEGTNTTSDLADTIELANGCACCNLQDELFASIEQILALADKRGEPYSRIVLENSGVAEPQQLRDKFSEAAAGGHPVMQRVDLDTLVTVVDASTFVKDYASRTPLASRPELGEGGNLRPVVDLLVEQIECADFVILNKVDLMPSVPADQPGGLDQLVAIVSSLNPLAAVHSCSNGKVPIDKVFGASSGTAAVVAKLNVEGQHRGAVAAARSAAAEAHKHDHKHDHGHDHKHAEDDCSACEHEHGHDHDHKHEHKHNHAHDGHAHDDCGACKHEHEHKAGGEHKHEEHNHAHDGHKHDDCGACKHEHKDAHGHHHHHTHEEDGHKHDDCRACEHEHHEHEHHHHHHEKPQTRAAARFGIKTFVYTRRRPFHPQRLKEMVLKWLPVATNKAIDGEEAHAGDSPIKTVLRSKGFMWMSNSHTTAYYWSHAGQHFEIRDEGDWWAAVPSADWPEEQAQVETILQDFEPSTGYGDRRQEIVFIGVGMDEAKISEQLDSALLTDDELAKYTQRWAATPDPVHPQAKKSKSAH